MLRKVRGLLEVQCTWSGAALVPLSESQEATDDMEVVLLGTRVALE